MNKATLSTTCDADLLASMCRAYGTSIHGVCPKGTFICPFLQREQDGTWIIKVPCRDVTSANWKPVLEPVNG